MHAGSLERLSVHNLERLLDILVSHVVHFSVAEVLSTFSRAGNNLAVVHLGRAPVQIVDFGIVIIGPFLDSDVVAALIVQIVALAALEVLGRQRAIGVAVNAVVLDCRRVPIVLNINIGDVVGVLLRIAPADRDTNAVTLVLVHPLGLQINQLNLAYERVR